MVPVISLEAAVAVSGRFPVLTGVDLTIDPGSIVLLEAPNGAGKTSLLRLCAGLLRLESGRAVVAGVDLAHDRRVVRPLVGYLGHGTGLYPDLTVRQNLRFWASAASNHAGRRSSDEIEAALDAVQLPERCRDLAVRRLSEGQQRRTALATVVQRRALIWLLDEPHAGLDNNGRDVLDQLLRLAASSGATVVFSSHEADRARHVAQRVVRMGAGRVIGDST